MIRRNLLALLIVVCGVVGIAVAQQGTAIVAGIAATTCTNQFVRSIAAATGAATCATVSLTADVTGTLPVANGGTGDTGTAWTGYTPTLSCSAGTITTSSATGRSKTLGKTVFVEINASITTIGSCSSELRASLPFTAGSTTYFIPGGEFSATGKAVQGRVLSGGTYTALYYYDNTFPGANSTQFVLTGVYESN